MRQFDNFQKFYQFEGGGLPIQELNCPNKYISKRVLPYNYQNKIIVWKGRADAESVMMKTAQFLMNQVCWIVLCSIENSKSEKIIWWEVWKFCVADGHTDTRTWFHRTTLRGSNNIELSKFTFQVLHHQKEDLVILAHHHPLLQQLLFHRLLSGMHCMRLFVRIAGMFVNQLRMLTHNSHKW